MLRIPITHASVLAALSVASAAPRESLPFTAVKPAGELRVRIEKNFERLHAERYQKAKLFTTSHDPTWPGDMEGRVTLGLVLDAQALGIDEPGIDELFAEFSKHYNKDGYFGPIHFPDHIDEQQLSSHGWMLRALCEYWLWKSLGSVPALKHFCLIDCFRFSCSIPTPILTLDGRSLSEAPRSPNPT